MAPPVADVVARALAHPATPEGKALAAKEIADALQGATSGYHKALFSALDAAHQSAGALAQEVRNSLETVTRIEQVENVLAVLAHYEPFSAHVAKFKGWKVTYIDPFAHAKSCQLTDNNQAHPLPVLELTSPTGDDTAKWNVTPQPNGHREFSLAWKNAPSDDKSFDVFSQLLSISTQNRNEFFVLGFSNDLRTDLEDPAYNLVAQFPFGRADEKQTGSTLFLFRTLDKIMEFHSHAPSDDEHASSDANERIKRLRRA